MEKQELELFLNKKIRLTKKNPDGKARYFTGVIQQLNVSTLILKDKYNCLVLIPYDTIQQIQQWTSEF